MIQTQIKIMMIQIQIITILIQIIIIQIFPLGGGHSQYAHKSNFMIQIQLIMIKLQIIMIQRQKYDDTDTNYDDANK